MQIKFLIGAIFIIILFNYSTLYGQLPDPITRSTTEFGTIKSDYGPRHFVKSPFHNGIDYKCGRGKDAFAVEAGEITHFGGSPWGGPYSNILVTSVSGDIWRYLHVESGTYTDDEGRKLWEYCPNCLGARGGDHDDFIILRTVVDNYLMLYAVITTTEYDGDDLYFYDDETNDEVEITTHIDQSEWIFMPRYLAPPMGPHLHIDRGFGMRLNPFELIAHDGNDRPLIEMPAIKRVHNNQAELFQPDDIIFGIPVILEAMVNTTHDKDLNEFSVSCINNNIKFEKFWRIAGSGHNIIGSNIFLTNPMTNVSWIQENINEGVYPYDPVDQNHNNEADPGYDYFKLHWPSKESNVTGQAEAWANERAKYPDGTYDVKFMATDITGNTKTETKQVVLDNHMPYVREVSLYSGKKIFGANVGYEDPEGESSDRGKLKYSVDEQEINDCADFENDLEFYVTTSEIMNEVSIEIPDAGTSGYTFALSPYYGDPLVWKGVIYKNELAGLFDYSMNYPMIISGVDKAGNEVINLSMSEENDEIPASWLPYRNDEGNWVNNFNSGETGYKIPFCSTDLIKAVFHAVISGNKQTLPGNNSLYGYSPLEVAFTDESTGGPVEWTWDFGDNSLPVNEQNPVHTFVNNTDEPVQYNVSLKACNESGCDITLESKLITVYPEGYDNIPIADFTYNQETYSSPFMVKFMNYSVGTINSFKWNFGDGLTNTSDFDPIHEYSSPGTYLVSLTLNPNMENEVVFTDEIEVLQASSGFTPVDFKWMCMANTDNMYSGEGITGEIINFESADYFYDSYYEWDMGDGTKYYNLSNPAHAYLETGTYSVTLHITNFAGELVGQKTKWINVVPNTQVIQPEENEISFQDADWITDMEIANDELFVTCCNDESKIFIYHFNGLQWVPECELPTLGDCYLNIAVSNDKMLVGEYYDNNSDKGKVHFYKKVNGVWLKQPQVLLDTEYDLYKFFGRSISMDNDWVMIHSDALSGGQKVSFWKYDNATNEWQCNPANNKYSYTDNRSSISHVKLIGNHAVWDYTFYVLQDGLWNFVWNPIIVEGGSLDSWDPLSETVSFSDSHLFSGWDGTLFSYKIMEDNSLQLLPYYKAPDNLSINFASSLSVFENYLVCGNNGDINGSAEIGIKGSSFIYRYNENGALSLFRTYYPSNGIEDDNFGAGVRIKQNHIVIASMGVNNDEFYKPPSIYYYHDYAYFGDRELYIPDFSAYNLKKESPERFAARIIDVAGDENKAAVSAGESVELIGQTITLKPGFSVTEGGVFTGTGTICEDYFVKSETNLKQSDSLNYLVNTSEFNEMAKNKDSFTIMPNPTTNKLFIISNSADDMIEKVVLFDSFGKLIKSITNNQKQRTFNISMNQFASGLYFISIRSKNKAEIKKVVKL